MKKWIAILDDKSEVTEDQQNWADIKDKVRYLSYDNNGQHISLPKNAEEYGQSKTASADLLTGKTEIESRNLWFKLGNNIVRIRVNEKNNNISIETQNLK